MDSADLNSIRPRAAGPVLGGTGAARLGLLEPDDLSAVAWVQAELRRSLESAHKTLRRYLRDAEAARQSELGTVEPAVLRGARAQLHQGVGALELVNMPAAAQVLRGAETLVQRMISKPAAATPAAVDAVERVSFALLDYLGRHLAGKPVSPVAMFPQYETAMALAGAERVHPADLWNFDATVWSEGLRLGAGPLADISATPRRADDASRSEMESLVLGLMREPGRNNCLRMSRLCADLAAGSRQVPGEYPLAGLWQCASAVYEALANGLLENDGQTKRVASRLLAQLRASARGQVGLSERLAQDLVFFCAHASPPGADRESPRLVAVRRAWKLDGLATAHYGRVRLGLHDPAVLAAAKRRVAAAKDTWAAVAGDEQHRMSNLMEQFALVGESLQKLFPSGDSLAHALSLAAAQTAASLSAPPPPLAMEVATAFLYVDAALEDGELDQAELPQRVQQLAQRVDQVRAGDVQQPLETWMEELYRRVSDRQTMGSVVQELRTSLSEIEKQIDQYFRQPSDNTPIMGVPSQLSSMRGVLSVLGMDHASQAVLHMRDDVEALLQTEVNPQQAIKTGTFNRLADNLGALGFLIDMLCVQPQLAKALFNFDASTGSLSTTMGLGERVTGFDALEAEPKTSAPEEPAERDVLDEPASALFTAPISTPFSTPITAAMAAPPPSHGQGPAPTPQAQPSAAAPARADSAAARAPAMSAAGPAPRPAPPAPLATPVHPVARAKGDSKLLVRLQALAAEAAQPNLGDDELLVSIETVMQQALAADRADLARILAAAQLRLRDSVDPGTSRSIRTDLVGAVMEATTPEPEPVPAARPVPAPRPTPAGGTGLEDDAELRGIFIEEARDVLDDALLALRHAQEAGGEAGADMTSIRRAFHTLKGSSRMVGLRDFGDAAWACEQLYNVRLAQSPVLDEPLAQLTSEALAYLRSWTEAIHTGSPALHQAQAIVSAADSLRVQGVWKRIAPVPEARASSTAQGGESSTLAARVSNLPSAADLDLKLAPVLPDAGAAEGPAPAPAPRQLVDFELELEPLGTPLPPRAADPQAPPPAASPPRAAAAEVLQFDFELYSSDESQEGGARAAQPLRPVAAQAPAPEAPARPLPILSLGAVPAAETLELDLDDLSEIASAGSLPIGFPGGSSPPPVLPPAAEPATQAAAAADTVPTADPPPAPPAPPTLAAPAAPAAAAARPPAADPVDEDENYKRIGPLRISIPLFNIFLNEADELSRRLVNELAEWAVEWNRQPVPETAVSLAHGLAGSAGTVGCADLSALARALEHALMRSRAAGPGRPGENALFTDTAEEIRRLLHQFAAGFLRDVPQILRDRLSEHERLPAPPGAAETAAPTPGVAPPAAAPLPSTGARRDAFDDDQDIDLRDTVDADLFPIFDEEADELLPQLQARLRDWMHQPADAEPPAACMRALHTFKGGARLAGAMHLGEMAHRLETAIEHLAAREGRRAADVLPLLGRADAMVSALESLRRAAAAAAAVPVLEAPAWLAEPGPQPLGAAAVPLPSGPETMVSPPAAALPPAPAWPSAPASAPALAPAPAPAPAPAVLPAAAERGVPVAPVARIDWAPFERGPTSTAGAEERVSTAPAGVRVRAALLDRLLNQAGEVTIARSRIDADVRQLQSGLGELGESLERMRRQLRDIEVQAETQISSRLEAAKAAAEAFDPLEMDRYTRLQELTRFMAESVNDVATLHRGLQRRVQSAEDQLAIQSRLTRDLQDDLLRTRMVEFESASDRLYRTVRQAAKEAGKQVRLDIVGGAIELDRGVLERMIGPFEHLLRNCVVHGVESEAERVAAGKPAVGQVTIAVAQSGNEVAVDIADDGAGLDLQRIRLRAIERRLLPDGSAPTEAELCQLIFKPGFSTTNVVTELAGRGVGLDVVRSEVTAMGGRIETQTVAGKGTRFKLLLPLTTAVTQVVMLRCDSLVVAVPSTLIEGVRRVPMQEIEAAYTSGGLDVDGETLPFYWLAALLRAGRRGHTAESRNEAVAVVRSAAQRVAVHIHEVVGNQEVVVKNVGPQLARVPGLAGVTLLPSGAVALIYNPVALAAVHGEKLRSLWAQQPLVDAAGTASSAPPPKATPLVMVVDDSLTVRRATERLLVRDGYRVVIAKDGMEALELLAGERPVALLSDIEMPRMDGFELLRHVRADQRLRDLPVVMITSRIAQKHREHATELGADHYLGKPYGEDELLRLVAGYAAGALRAGSVVPPGMKPAPVGA